MRNLGFFALISLISFSVWAEQLSCMAVSVGKEGSAQPPASCNGCYVFTLSYSPDDLSSLKVTQAKAFAAFVYKGGNNTYVGGKDRPYTRGVEATSGEVRVFASTPTIMSLTLNAALSIYDVKPHSRDPRLIFQEKHLKNSSVRKFKAYYKSPTLAGPHLEVALECDKQP